MTVNTPFDVIIVGGSYSGLSAAMSLGRALRKILVIDGGLPCNRQAPHSHNFITHDGQVPAQIAAQAKKQVEAYRTVQFYTGLAVNAQKTEAGFEVRTQARDVFTAKRLIFATGLKDVMPDIKGFADCWGISVMHCPYCHGYEVRGERTGILANGDGAFHYAQLILNWTKDLVIFTNGPSTISAEQTEKIKKHNITIIETALESLVHQNGKIQAVMLTDGSQIQVNTIYSRPIVEQHCSIPAELGCELTEQGLIKVDAIQKTSVAGVFACGDNSTMARAVSVSVAAGTMAGIACNNHLLEEEF